MEQSRKLINVYQFNNEPLRILVASLGSGLRPTDAFLASTLYKHLLRELKLADTALKSPDTLKWNAQLRRYGSGGASVKDEVDEDDDTLVEGTPAPDQKAVGDKAALPTKGNPVSIALYGQICLAAKSYQSALCGFVSTQS